MDATNSTQIHIVMFPFFAFGHINPFVQLSNKLSSHGIRISFLSAIEHVSRIESTLIVSPNTKLVPLQIPPPVSHLEERNMVQAIDQMQPQIKTLLADLKPHFVMFDFAQYWLPRIASELGIKTLFFSIFTAISTSYLTCPARVLALKEEEAGAMTIEHLKKPPPGFPNHDHDQTSINTFEAESFMFLFTKFNDHDPTVYERVMNGLVGCTAIVAKTCYEMEGHYLDFVKTQFHNKNVLLTGPLVFEPVSGILLDDKFDKWLSQFPEKSVIFCSFGSESFLTNVQINEIALGLELTGLPFLLVLNFPDRVVDSQAELERALQKGFMDRVKDRGMAYTGWVQQPLILAHPSVGCYVCHSGFSSIIEAAVSDCQLVLVPLKGDQFLNARLICEDMKSGVKVSRRDEDGYFGKEDVYAAVKIVMLDAELEPGRSVRANHRKWREFLMNKEIQNNFISDLVKELKIML